MATAKYIVWNIIVYKQYKPEIIMGKSGLEEDEPDGLLDGTPWGRLEADRDRREIGKQFVADSNDLAESEFGKYFGMFRVCYPVQFNTRKKEIEELFFEIYETKKRSRAELQGCAVSARNLCEDIGWDEPEFAQVLHKFYEDYARELSNPNRL